MTRRAVDAVVRVLAESLRDTRFHRDDHGLPLLIGTPAFRHRLGAPCLGDAGRVRPLRVRPPGEQKLYRRGRPPPGAVVLLIGAQPALAHHGHDPPRALNTLPVRAIMTMRRHIRLKRAATRAVIPDREGV